MPIATIVIAVLPLARRGDPGARHHATALGFVRVAPRCDKLGQR